MFKLKVRGKELNDFYAIVDEETDGHRFYEEVKTLERAEIIVERINGWDEIQEQLADYKEGCEGLKLAVGDLRQERDNLMVEKEMYRKCHESELGVCQKHCDIVNNLIKQRDDLLDILKELVGIIDNDCEIDSFTTQPANILIFQIEEEKGDV